ncbi:hypothetical protein JWS13_01990 (plasmid) [Rhodococcus pseudokoreensis]|uniref:Uncharacterized protein n=1 Tax=Rhodococcus pseudokoreensis TaxID=2811421 RepID=A0A974ZRE9_9NOCA|nr:hypothetical protein [Rhodococcus pseudokoreensis]QSE87426.1 hypothetical protein JWS13_01990 [Rhodococcus pseudokoreensis]
MTTLSDTYTSPLPSGVDADQLERLLEVRRALQRERATASSPAVGRALQMADYYLFLGLSYFGYSEKLFPEQE